MGSAQRLERDEKEVMEYEGGMQLEAFSSMSSVALIDGAGFHESQRKMLTEAFNQAKQKGLWNDGRAAQRFRRVTGDEPVSLIDSLVKAFPI